MSTSSTRPPSCMYCFGELSPIEGTPANMLFPSERDSANSRSRPPPRARFLGEERGWLFLDGACQTCSQSSRIMSRVRGAGQSCLQWLIYFAKSYYNLFQTKMRLFLDATRCTFLISNSLLFFFINHSTKRHRMSNGDHNMVYFVFGIWKITKELIIDNQNWYPFSSVNELALLLFFLALQFILNFSHMTYFICQTVLNRFH